MSKLLKIFTCSSSMKPKEARHKAKTDTSPLSPNLQRKLDSQPNYLSNVELIGHSRKGSGRNKRECQDTYDIQHQLLQDIHFFAVYDGHGPKGKEVSLFVNDHINHLLKREASKLERLSLKGQMDQFFKTAMKNMDAKIRKSDIDVVHSGSCCIAVLLHRMKCFVINLGDSRAVLCRQTQTGSLKAIELSEDHKPSRPDERERVQQRGGIVEPTFYNGTPVGPLRVWTPAKDSGVAMTRTIGDTSNKKFGLIAEPEVTEFDLQLSDQFIIIASDGLWDVMSSEEAIWFVEKYIKDGKAKNQVSKALTYEAKKRWASLDEEDPESYCDDITVVVAFTEFLEELSETRNEVVV